MNKKINIAILYGGYSSEREISRRGALNILSILDKSKYNSYLVDIASDKWSVIFEENIFPINKDDFSFTVNDIKTSFDFVLINIHGIPGENGMIQAYLDMISLPYSSCSFLSSSLTFDKDICKRLAAITGVKMAQDIIIKRNDVIDYDAIVNKLGLPLFVKPTASGSSFGVTKVKTISELPEAINLALSESDNVIIEEYIEGTEVSCGILITKNETIILPPTEIVSQTEYFDYDAKYNGLSSEITPARISNEVLEKLAFYTEKIYKSFACSGVIRIDYIIKNDVPYFIETNTIPGMSAQSIIPQQVKCYGIDMTQFFNKIIEDKL